MRRLLLVSLFATCAVANEPALPPDLEPVPDGSPTLRDAPPPGSQPAPQVSVVRQLDGTVEEYRINGRLYMVKVLPDKGIPYFLIDSDGNGTLESRYNNGDERVLIPGWVINF